MPYHHITPDTLSKPLTELTKEEKYDLLIAREMAEVIEDLLKGDYSKLYEVVETHAFPPFDDELEEVWEEALTDYPSGSTLTERFGSDEVLKELLLNLAGREEQTEPAAINYFLD